MGEAVYHELRGVHIVAVRGSHHAELGRSYGAALSHVLRGARDHLISSFARRGIGHQRLLEHAIRFHRRYSYPWSLFLDGVGEGARIAHADVMMLNAMETLVELLPHDEQAMHCSFVFVPPNRTAPGMSSLIGRNYDFDPSIYGPIASNLTVAVLQIADALPTAIVGLPGQIYCPNCFNSRGIFMELNDGSPSGGASINTRRQTMLIRMLQAMQTSPTLEALQLQMAGLKSDFSLIVNTADATEALSYEYSAEASLGSRPYTPRKNDVFASTNYFLNSSWLWGRGGVPWPRDENTWYGVTRRNNLLKLSARIREISFADMQQIIATPAVNGGAQSYATIYQLVFDLSTLSLSLRRPLLSPALWVNLNMSRYMQPDT